MPLLDPEDIKILSLGAIWNFGIGTDLSWADIRLWGTQGLSIRHRCIGTVRDQTKCKSMNPVAIRTHNLSRWAATDQCLRPSSTVTGYCTGTVTGYSSGRVTGYCTDTVTGYCTDTVTGYSSGRVTGYCTGTVTGYCTGTFTGYCNTRLLVTVPQYH